LLVKPLLIFQEQILDLLYSAEMWLGERDYKSRICFWKVDKCLWVDKQSLGTGQNLMDQIFVYLGVVVHLELGSQD
jgi:hypothetical protein